MVLMNKIVINYLNLFNKIFYSHQYSLFLGYCQGDVYACLQGNNVSCRFACTTYGRVTCLSYQNIRACEQYIREYNFDISSTSKSSILINGFDALQYSAYLAIGILLFISIISILIYLIRKKSSLCSTKKSVNTNLNRLSSISHQQLNLSRSYYTPAPNIHDLPPSYHYTDQNINDSYEPPPYPGPPLFSSNSNYYETIKLSSISNSMSMLNPLPLPEPDIFTNIQTHCV